ncbi:MAG: hypothetical protein ACTSRG_02295 [Candidatus Helarchaeota archaeon]
MTAIGEFFKEDIKIKDRTHNSQIILERIDEIQGTSENIFDQAIKSIRINSINTLPWIDTFINFVQISTIEMAMDILERDFRHLPAE